MEESQIDDQSKNSFKIMLDLTFLFDQYSKRGIGIYGKNVLSRLIKKLVDEGRLEIHLIGFHTLSENLIELGYSQFTIEEISPTLRFHSLGDEKLSGIKNFKTWESNYKPVLEEVKPQVFYAVHFERGLPSVPRLAQGLTFKPKTIVIAHDAIPLVTNKFSSKGIVANFLKKRFYKNMWKGVQNADLVITASEFSKKDIVNYGKVDPNKIKVVYLGVDEKFRKSNYSPNPEVEENTLEAYELINKKYFIYDSGVEANKGATHLLNIFKEVLNLNSPDLPNYLVVIGKDFYKGTGYGIKPKSILGDKFLKMARKLGVAQNLITTDKISDEHLITLLFNAGVYLNLSTYEGFGLGIAQAMSAEIPVIASNTSCIPEIAQDGAFLIDIKNDIDYSETAKKIRKYLTNKDKMETTMKLGVKVSKQYVWEKTVAETTTLIYGLL